MISLLYFSPTNSPGVVVLQELFMLSVSQEIYSRRVRLVFKNRGKLFDAQYRAHAFRLLINIDRDVGTSWGGPVGYATPTCRVGHEYSEKLPGLQALTFIAGKPC